MGRWEPGAQDRLRMAAMELFVERGYDQTTVTDIAERAGVTARTFFRHFADKREVLFPGSGEFEAHVVGGLADAPADASPLGAVAAALDAAAAFLADGRAFSGPRQAVITANAELRERELIKMASLSGALAEGLRVRGVVDPDARLAAEAGIAVFRVAFDDWVTGPADGDLAAVIRDSMDRLRGLTA